jgi:hypothetical protein
VANNKYEIPEIGQTFGGWTVIDNKLQANPDTKGTNKCVKVKCKCGDVQLYTLPNLYKNSSGCRKCCDRGKVKFCGELSHTYFKSVKHNAEVRNLEFDVSIDFLWNLFLDQDRRCALSNAEIVLNPYMNWKQTKLAQTASVDRKDSSKGYTEENVQWVHKHINQMKMNLTQDNFLDLCALVTKHDNNRMKTKIISRCNVEGIHRWKECPIEEVKYLRDYHRHVFNIICYAYVSHNDRDIEFIQLSHDIKTYLTEKYYNKKYKCLFFDDCSCEMIAEEILNKFNLYEVEVNEDGEGGAIVRSI